MPNASTHPSQLIPGRRLRTMTSNQANPAFQYIRAKSVTKLTIAIAVLLLASIALAEDRPSTKASGGQKPMTAMEAYKHVQQMRDEAEELWKQTEPSKEDLEKAITILEKKALP